MKRKPENSMFLILFWIILSLAILLSIGKARNTMELNESIGTVQNQEKRTELSDKSNNPESTREAYFAGTFYPQDQNELKSLITKYLNAAKKKETNEKLRFLIVPHAGLTYSGPVAADGYKQIDFSQYSRIILLGSAHSSNKKAISIYTEGIWETPLGKSSIDSEFAKRLIDENEDIIFDKTMHENDHILEMQLLFIQQASLETKIVPISIGNVDDITLSILANKIAFLMDDETLIIVSSDLSHYPTYEKAQVVDEETIQAILTGNSSAFANNLQERRKDLKDGLETYACGEKAIKTLLQIAEMAGINKTELLKYANSGDQTEEKTKVVGYAAIGGWSEKLQPLVFTQEDKDEALKIAKDTLETYLSTKEIDLQYTDNPKLHIPMGVFSTIKNNGTLRGCVGVFEPQEPLYYSLQKYTLEAAINDKRFTPIKPRESKDLSIELSLMSEKTQVSSVDEVTLGTHGVQIINGINSGTFLPEVAEQLNMDKTKFFEELCFQKAHLETNCYEDPKTKIFIFTTDKAE